MHRTLAIALSSAAIVTGGAGTADASDQAYPPVQPNGTVHTAPARPAPSAHVAPERRTAAGGMTVPGATGNDSVLPRTGAQWVATAAVGGGLLVAGSSLVVAARRRRAA